MSDAVFAYGTLMVPEIWQAVTGLSEETSARAARLWKYQRRRVKGADFPGVIDSGNAVDFVEGCIFEGVGAEVLEKLDQYEDSFYQRIELNVEIIGCPGKSVAAQTYVVAESSRHILSDQPWTLDWFKSNALARYLDALGI